MTQRFENNVSVQILNVVSPTDTTLTLFPGQGASFPVLSTGDKFVATLNNFAGFREIVWITARTTDVLTIVRGQENTTPLTWMPGDSVDLRITRDTLVNLQNTVIKANTITGYDATGLTDGTNVIFKGRDTLDDGGGGVFEYYTTSTATVDGGTVFAPTGGGRLIRQGYTASGFNGPLNAPWFGIHKDGTDQTTALVNLLGTLGTAGFRGRLSIPYNTKFTIATVYAAVPVGVTLEDESGINIGHTPNDIQRFRMVYSGDTSTDDYGDALASGHHPARFFVNTGTAGTSSASGRFMSEIFSLGPNYAGDLLTTMLRQHKKDAGGSKWMFSYRVQTPYSVAIANPQNWAASTAYSANAYVISDSGKVYTTTAGGTSGNTAPTGTGSGINDGGVLWNYVQAAINIDSTYREEDEQGNVRQFGMPTLSPSMYHYWDHSGTRVTLTVNGTTHDVTYSDLTRNWNFLTVKDGTGVQLGGVRSFPWVTVSGSTPAITSSYLYINNGSATNMTDMTLPGSQTQGYMVLLFANANTTLKNVTNGGNFSLKGNVDATPPQGGVIEFIKFTSLSGAWIEKSRSF